MWTDYWGLSADPFFGAGSPFVRTPGVDEAVARLADAIETGQRLAVLRAGEGVGKSALLTHVVAEMKGPRRRFARVNRPLDGTEMMLDLAAGLGAESPRGASRSVAWKGLSDAVKLCRWQTVHAVLVIDDGDALENPDDLRDLERLPHLDPNPRARLTVIRTHREHFDGPGDPWQLQIRIPTLTLSESRGYVEQKLAAAGRTDPAFGSGAIARLYDLSGGVPRGLDRLGSLALMAGGVPAVGKDRGGRDRRGLPRVRNVRAGVRRVKGWPVARGVC